jgi:hypothetical protein
MKIISKYWVILILCLIVVGMAIVKTKYGYIGSEIPLIPTSTIVPTQEPTPTFIPGFELLNSLPYQGVGFVVDKYLAPNVLNVKIKGIDQKLATKMVLKWLEENKVATSSYKLKFE